MARSDPPPASRGLVKPVAGVVAAGAPSEPQPPDGDEVDFGRLFASPEVQLLRVRGDSMVEAGILDGDYVALRPPTGSDEGRIVVCEVGGGHTLKTLLVHDGEFFLSPANRRMKPVKLGPDSQPRVLGVYVALLRIPGKVRR